MPVVARLPGVTIAVFPNDHPPPHFHAYSAEYRASIDIETLTVTEGSLPIAIRRRVLAWAAPRREALFDRFNKAIARDRVEPIP